MMKDEDCLAEEPSGCLDEVGSVVSESSPPYVDLKRRTREFSLAVIRLVATFPRLLETQVISNQVLRSATSVGAQYREGVRARSDAEFVSKLQGAAQELEETMYWLEIIEEMDFSSVDDVKALIAEADELMAILTTCIKRVKFRQQQKA